MKQCGTYYLIGLVRHGQNLVSQESWLNYRIELSYATFDLSYATILPVLWLFQSIQQLVQG